MKKFFKIIFYITITSLIGLYLGIVFLLPQIINSKFTTNKLQAVISEKTGTQTTITGLNLKITPNLVAVLKINSLDAKNKDVSVADIKNLALNYKLLQKHLTLISADNIYIDGNSLKQFKNPPKKEKKGDFDLNKIPEIHIANIIYNSDEVNVQAQNIDTTNGIIQLKIDVNIPFLKETIKIGDSGSLQYTENGIKANKFEITLGNSHLYLDGILADKNKYPNFDIKGKNLPISELVPIVLKCQKALDSSKKFIENFKDFKGMVNVNLKMNKDGLWGTCVTNNFGSKDVMFNIPTFFKEVVINFRGQSADSTSVGTTGNEKIIHILNITDLLSPQIEVIGTAKTTLTKKFNYVPNFKVLNSVNVKVVYKIKDRKPDVYYDIDIPVNSDLIYDSFYLGLRDYNRNIHANTFKDNNDLYLREYKYSYSDINKENIILYGDGLFIKNIDKNNPDIYVPQYLTMRTNGYAPTSVIGSFGEKIRGGEFKGDLNYDFKNNQLLGTFDIIKAGFKDFRIEKAHVTSQNGIFNITSNGFYKGEKYLAELSAKNNIYGETLVYNMKLFLDKLILETTQDTDKKQVKIDSDEISKKVKDFDITINNWEIVINEIIRDKFVLQNVHLLGSMKNNIFDFKMQDMNFADGTINAKGFYNFAKNTSEMSFAAKNINSNKVAEMTLNLKDQIEGIASAKVNISAKDMFRFIDAHCMFEVKEGFLPKLGDAEFMFKNTKYKLSEITNFDLGQKDLMKDDIKGSFDVHNTELKNIAITTWHEMSAMYLEGDYDMEKQLADLQLFWKYSKDAPKGIRIFSVPLSLILKVVFRPEQSKDLYKTELSKIPAIKSDEKHTTYYRVKLKGDINNNKIDLTLKEIR